MLSYQNAGFSEIQLVLVGGRPVDYRTAVPPCDSLDTIVRAAYLKFATVFYPV